MHLLNHSALGMHYVAGYPLKEKPRRMKDLFAAFRKSSTTACNGVSDDNGVVKDQHPALCVVFLEELNDDL